MIRIFVAIEESDTWRISKKLRIVPNYLRERYIWFTKTQRINCLGHVKKWRMKEWLRVSGREDYIEKGGGVDQGKDG